MPDLSKHLPSFVSYFSGAVFGALLYNAVLDKPYILDLENLIVALIVGVGLTYFMEVKK